MTGATSAGDHARLMDAIYRRQRHVYDATRKYYLFGRDRLLHGLALPQRGGGAAVLEIGCGTGRNLAVVAGNWPEAALFGVDISAEMLKSAEARLGTRAVLALGDATTFDAAALLGRERFDRVVMPYCLSMISAWVGAMEHACGLLARGGSLHVVDFGDMAGLPGVLRAPLRRWLKQFHVTPRSDLISQAMRLSVRHGLASQVAVGWGGYYHSVILTRPR